VSDKGMSNKEYLEKVKKVDEDYDFDHDNLEYRQAKATEIIARELINIKHYIFGLTTIYKDVVIDVNNLKGKVNSINRKLNRVNKPMGKMGKNEKTNNTH